MKRRRKLRRRVGDAPAPAPSGGGGALGTALVVAGLGLATYGVYRHIQKRKIPAQLEVTTFTVPGVPVATTAKQASEQSKTGHAVAQALNYATTAATIGAGTGVVAGAAGAAAGLLPLVLLAC